jgi:DUF177 domain-containing protein
LKIKVMEIPEQERTYRFTLHHTVLEPVFGQRPDVSAPFQAEVGVSVYRFETDVQMHGMAVLSATIGCARCGDEAEAAISIRWRMTFTQGSEDTPIEESDGHGYYSGEEIDFASIALEQIELNLPQTLLCDADCKGLCYICGRNLNDDECGCPR